IVGSCVLWLPDNLLALFSAVAAVFDTIQSEVYLKLVFCVHALYVTNKVLDILVVAAGSFVVTNETYLNKLVVSLKDMPPFVHFTYVYHN
ncbi:hypothetical protein, partial [Salmonella enterica]|uniref:hypothetical protein n=1 Tax=Salmonella enterica TaxID=28901 RepID=UPI0020C316EB